MPSVFVVPASIQFPIVYPGQTASPQPVGLYVTPPMTSGQSLVVTIAITTEEPDGVFVAELIQTTKEFGQNFEVPTLRATTSGSAASGTLQGRDPMFELIAYSIQVHFTAPATPVPGVFTGTLNVTWPGGVQQNVTLNGTTVQRLPPIVLSPVEACMRSVTVSDVVEGARVDVYVNNALEGAIASATSTVVEVPLSSSPGKAPLSVKDVVYASQSLGSLSGGDSPPVTVIDSAGFYYHTQHFNTERTGWNHYETTLNVANVPNLKTKPVITQNLDGTVFAQPLYAHHVNIPGSGAHNVVYVATENDRMTLFMLSKRTLSSRCCGSGLSSRPASRWSSRGQTFPAAATSRQSLGSRRRPSSTAHRTRCGS